MNHYSNYYPAYWVVVKVTPPKKDGVEVKPIFKVLAQFSGSYLSGESWKLNSGITEYKEEGGKLFFIGSSGSCYVCSKEREGLGSFTVSIFASLKESLQDIGGDMEKLSFEEFEKEFKK